MAAHRMPLAGALEVLRDLRRDEIVVTTMGTAREWPKLSSHPLDFHYIPSAMGHAGVLGLGIALAQPRRTVIAFSGDGGMLMSLGSLVTIATCRPANLTLIVIDNGIYEVTGGQKTAAAVGRVDFVALAKAAGFESARRFTDLADWKARAAETLALAGPRFVVLECEPVGCDYMLESPGPMAERIAKFRTALGT